MIGRVGALGRVGAQQVAHQQRSPHIGRDDGHTGDPRRKVLTDDFKIWQFWHAWLLLPVSPFYDHKGDVIELGLISNKLLQASEQIVSKVSGRTT
jgi:hypothetical protein